MVCGQRLPLERYSISGYRKDGTPCYHGECKACRAAYTARWRRAHPERQRDHTRRWRAKHPDYSRRYRLARVLERAGLPA